jgi:hypothetical protein
VAGLQGLVIVNGRPGSWVQWAASQAHAFIAAVLVTNRTAPSIHPFIHPSIHQVYLFATPARMARPVQYLPTGQTELIGSLEQVFGQCNAIV